MADLRHVIPIRANHLALTTQAAGIDWLVHHMIAHDDGHIVIDLSRQQPREFIVMSEVRASLDAFIAVTLDAARRFCDGLLFAVDAITRDLAGRTDAIERCI